MGVESRVERLARSITFIFMAGSEYYACCRPVHRNRAEAYGVLGEVINRMH
ncbi:MAG: hypothetical protein LM589_02425 [Thermosphaera sp.]|nr:hypothetical protein [Thermosphaera sp.]